MVGYRQAHRRVEKAKGPAKSHTCACGKPARQWAYRASDPTGYSLNPDDYEAMCVSCHMKVDLGVGANAERLASISHLGNATLVQKFQDPEYVESRRPGLSKAGKAGGAVVSRLKRKCVECGLVANPGNLAQHQRFQSHEGVLDV